MFKPSLFPFVLGGGRGSSSKKMRRGEKWKNKCSFFSGVKSFQSKTQVVEHISVGMEEAPKSVFSNSFQCTNNEKCSLRLLIKL